ncbi:MAG: hypothetical protein OHK0024_29400 [Thalassobaculales bacterium]
MPRSPPSFGARADSQSTHMVPNACAAVVRVSTEARRGAAAAGGWAVVMRAWYPIGRQRTTAGCAGVG